MRGFNLTIEQLEKLKAAGRIKGFKEIKKGETNTLPHPLLVTEKKVYQSEGKQYIHNALQRYADERHTELRTEYQFHKPRRFRFDWCLPELWWAVEYEGIYSETSRHTFFTGFNRDCEKYNMAMLDRFRVLRYTAKNYKNIDNDLTKII